MMGPVAPTFVGTLREGPPTRHDLVSDTEPSFSIEQHLVLQPILYNVRSALLYHSHKELDHSLLRNTCGSFPLPFTAPVFTHNNDFPRRVQALFIRPWHRARLSLPLGQPGSDSQKHWQVCLLRVNRLVNRHHSTAWMYTSESEAAQLQQDDLKYPSCCCTSCVIASVPTPRPALRRM